MIVARRAAIIRYPKGSWHETNLSPGLSIHTVVTREASCGEQGGACAREGGRGQVSGKNTKKKSGTPVEAKGAVNDTSRMALLSGVGGGGAGCGESERESGRAQATAEGKNKGVYVASSAALSASRIRVTRSCAALRAAGFLACVESF
jgi:hypothetical protein